MSSLSFTQGREFQREKAETEVEVGAKETRFRGFVEVSIGGCHDTHVHRFYTDVHGEGPRANGVSDPAAGEPEKIHGVRHAKLQNRGWDRRGGAGQDDIVLELVLGAPQVCTTSCRRA